MMKLATMVTALALALPVMCSGQAPLDPTRLEIDRAALTRLLAQYEAVAQSTGYSDETRQEGLAKAEIIRERLRSGDFRSGDRIALLIEGEEAGQWDTLTVEPDLTVDVATLGPISLEGVLRSELQAHLTTEVARFIQSPIVRAHALIRISILGVTRPGFYTMAADLPLTEAVMLAGGPAPGSRPGEIRIERGRDVLWSVEDLFIPVADGRTLDQLGLQEGDRVLLPVDPAGAQAQLVPAVLRDALYILVPLFLGVRIR